MDISLGLLNINTQIKKLEKSVDKLKNKNELKKAGLLDEIEALKAQTDGDERVIAEEEEKVNPKSYYVIIGSFPTKKLPTSTLLNQIQTLP